MCFEHALNQLINTKGWMMEMQKRENDLREWTYMIAKNAGKDTAFADDLIERLNSSNEIMKEYLYYMDNRTFLGEYSVGGMTVVDIMIWQMDHFKSDLDRGLYDMQSNPDRMLLSAFETMLQMEKEPQKYLERYGQDTGTDYPGKY